MYSIRFLNLLLVVTVSCYATYPCNWEM